MNNGFKFLLNKISEKRGFNCGYYKETAMRRRILSRMRRMGIDSYMKYSKFLEKNPEEYSKLIDALTVNVSEFFRDPSTFEVIKEIVIPNLVTYKEFQNRKVIRVWSAGCATGEEAYSVAILFREYLGEEIEQYIFTVTATDIDRKSLEKAIIGIYRKEKLKNLKKPYLKYFEKENSFYRIREEIKRHVRFLYHDVISGEKFKYFDIIICRNVLIYFSRDTQREIFKKFYMALNPGGYLIIGKTETLTKEMSKKFEIIDLHERVYRKPPWR